MERPQGPPRKDSPATPEQRRSTSKAGRISRRRMAPYQSPGPRAEAKEIYKRPNESKDKKEKGTRVERGRIPESQPMQHSNGLANTGESHRRHRREESEP
jgi:hypothetical protein